MFFFCFDVDVDVWGGLLVRRRRRWGWGGVLHSIHGRYFWLFFFSILVFLTYYNYTDLRHITERNNTLNPEVPCS